jgi:hypothetical protein
VVLVIAILNLIIGSLGILSSLAFSLLMLGGGERALSSQVVSADLQKMQKETNGYTNDELYAYREAHLPAYELTQDIKVVVDLIANLLLITGAVGLLRMTWWSRPVTLFYAGFDLLMQAAVLMLVIVFLFPVIDGFFESMAPSIDSQQKQIAAQFAQMFWKLGYAAGTGIWMAYPLLVLVIMFLPSVRLAFRGTPAHQEQTAPSADRP